jgi:hypothetical protein
MNNALCSGLHLGSAAAAAAVMRLSCDSGKVLKQLIYNGGSVL